MTRWPGEGAHPDLVAIFQSRRGRIALLLRQTLVPLPEERSRWLNETRGAARAVIAGLRARGFTGPLVVLQWRSFGQTAEVLRGWRCRYDGDPVRRAELTRVVERRLADQRYLDALRTRTDSGQWSREAFPAPLDDPASRASVEAAGPGAGLGSAKEP
jgi:hypothetical protein